MTVLHLPLTLPISLWMDMTRIQTQGIALYPIRRAVLVANTNSSTGGAPILSEAGYTNTGAPSTRL